MAHELASRQAKAARHSWGSVLPTTDQLARERTRQQHVDRTWHAIRQVIATVVVAAAVAVLASTLAFPLYQIYGDSMEPTLSSGDVVVAHREVSVERGDIVAFWYNSRILVKRVIAVPGDTIDVGDDGTVYLNGESLDESYLKDGSPSRGTINVTLPYEVPEGRYFVMGDNRAVSLDSRVSDVGCVSLDQMAGKLVFRLWPLSSMGGLT